MVDIRLEFVVDLDRTTRNAAEFASGIHRRRDRVLRATARPQADLLTRDKMRRSTPCNSSVLTLSRATIEPPHRAAPTSETSRLAAQHAGRLRPEPDHPGTPLYQAYWSWYSRNGPEVGNSVDPAPVYADVVKPRSLLTSESASMRLRYFFAAGRGGECHRRPNR